MYYYTVNGVKCPISAGKFWGLMGLGLTIALVIDAAVLYVVGSVFGWLGVAALIALSIQVTIDGKAYRLIPFKVVSDLIVTILVISAIVIYIMES